MCQNHHRTSLEDIKRDNWAVGASPTPQFGLGILKTNQNTTWTHEVNTCYVLPDIDTQKGINRWQRTPKIALETCYALWKTSFGANGRSRRPILYPPRILLASWEGPRCSWPSSFLGAFRTHFVTVLKWSTCHRPGVGHLFLHFGICFMLLLLVNIFTPSIVMIFRLVALTCSH